SKTQADLTIRLLDQFGPVYFEIAQLTRLSPQTYRCIEPAVKDGVLHLEGEAIPITLANSQKLVAAIATLRREAAGAKTTPERSVSVCLKDIANRCDQLVADLRKISLSEREGSGDLWLAVAGAIAQARGAIERLYRESGR